MAEREDVAALAEELWFCSTSPGAAPTDTERDLARRILASDWLAAYVAAKQAEALREAAAQWVDGGLITTDNLRRFLRDRAAQTEARP